MKNTRILMGLFILVLFTGCMTNGTYSGDVAEDNTFRQINHIGYTGFVTGGTEYSTVENCVWDPDTGTATCVPAAGSNQRNDRNNAVMEILAGPAATVGGAYLIANGIEDSGDSNETNINNSSVSTATGNGGNGGLGGGGGNGGNGNGWGSPGNSGGNHPGCANSGNC